MNRLPDIGQVSDLRLGDHPGFDAWFYSFCAENNIEHGINPSGVASPEQLRFMVAMDERQVYAPCSDATFRELAASFHLRSFPPRVRSQYIAAWRSIIRVVRYEKDRQKRRDMINYCRHRFRGCLALGNILPSRLVKRLVTTLISHFDAGDPWLNERLFYNETLASFLRSQTLQKALGRLPDGLSAEGIPDLRRALDLAELARLFHLAGRSHHTLTQLIHNCAAAESGKCELPDIFTGSEAFLPQVGQQVLLAVDGMFFDQIENCLMTRAFQVRSTPHQFIFNGVELLGIIKCNQLQFLGRSCYGKYIAGLQIALGGAVSAGIAGIAVFGISHQLQPAACGKHQRGHLGVVGADRRQHHHISGGIQHRAAR